ncbi:MAG TPA: hypothetical protein VGM74_11810 [Burkholderiaceae bacterium]
MSGHGIAMRRWPFAPTDFAHARLVVSAPRGLRQRLVIGLAVLAAFAGGAVLGHFQDPWRLVMAATATTAPAESAELPKLRQAVEQSQLQLRVAEARGHELERQIDALNQQLRAAQEELTFFHKARDTKR